MTGVVLDARTAWHTASLIAELRAENKELRNMLEEAMTALRAVLAVDHDDA